MKLVQSDYITNCYYCYSTQFVRRSGRRSVILEKDPTPRVGSPNGCMVWRLTATAALSVALGIRVKKRGLS
jgi:ribosomal protein L36